jgi:ribosomal protein S6--L-glutamate ligase
MKIVILSRNARLYSTRRLIEAAEIRGHEALVLDHTKCYMSLKQGQPSIHYKGKEIENVNAVIPRIGASVTFYGTAIVRQFEMMNIFSANPSQAITRSRDKLRSMQLLAKAGLGMPITGFANHINDVDDLINMVGGAPLVIKLLEGTQGIGVVLAETTKAAQSVIEAFHGLDADILIQEFIKESRGADIRAFVVNGRIVGAMKRQAKDGEFRSNLHRGGTSSLINLTMKERYTALKAAKVLGLSVAGVDMLQSKRGPLIMEVNSSPGLEGIERATGEDIAGKIIEFVEQNAGKKRMKDKIGA